MVVVGGDIYAFADTFENACTIRNYIEAIQEKNVFLNMLSETGNLVCVKSMLRNYRELPFVDSDAVDQAYTVEV